MGGSPENTVLHPLHQVQFATHAKLKVDDYYHNGARRRLRLHEKGGKEHDMPVHHLLERILDEYIVVAGPLERVFSPPVGCHTWRAIGMNFIRRFGMS